MIESMRFKKQHTTGCCLKQMAIFQSLNICFVPLWRPKSIQFGKIREKKNVLQEYNIETKIIINSSESQHKTKVNFLVNNKRVHTRRHKNVHNTLHFCMNKSRQVALEMVPLKFRLEICALRFFLIAISTNYCQIYRFDTKNWFLCCCFL